MKVSVWKRLKSFVRGVRESRDHRITKYGHQSRNEAYAAGRAFARWIMRKH